MKPPLALKRTTIRLLNSFSIVGFLLFLLVPAAAFGIGTGGKFVPPSLANDDCSGAVSLTSATSCTNYSGTLNSATASSGIPAGCASAGTHYDAWFSFSAVAASQTVTVSGIGSNITNPELQLYSGTCGSLSSVQCGASSLTATGLTIGITYYLRFSNIGADPSGSGSAPKFSICVTHAASLALSRGPYLQSGAQTAITFRWRTNVASNSRVEVGTSFGSYTLVTDDATSTTEHSVRVTGLSADTKYWYRIGSTTQSLQGASDNFFTTLPTSAPGRKLRFAVFGDCGKGDATYQSQSLTQYQSYLTSNSIDAPDAWLLLGDNAYNAGTDAEYTSNFFGTYGTSILKNHKLYPVPGNHDYANSTTNQDTHSLNPYYTIFDLPSSGEAGGFSSNKEEYYSYDIGNVHFLALDAYGEESNLRLYDTTGAQAVWIKNDLAAYAFSGKWIVAYWHHPPYTKGSHNSDSETELISMRENFIRILERYGVDMIINGHSHDYERSKLMKGYYKVNPLDASLLESNFNTSYNVSQSTGAYTSASTCPYTTSSTAANKGTVYVVAGSTGASGTTQTGYPHDALPLSVNDGGVFYFEVDNNRLDAKFIERTGAIYDQFTIMRDVNKTTNYNVNVNTPVTLTSSWPGNYVWSTSATSQSIIVTPIVTGTTNYTVTDSYGCVTDNFSVTATAVLPVSLLNYDARLVGDKVNINWSTSSETNSKEFIVEKSGNATGNFQLVGKQAAAGESGDVRNYMMVDPQPMKGVSYYRLSQTDLDGRLRYYDARKINNQSSSFTVNQVANENGSLILQIKATQPETLKLKVVDLAGKEIIVTNIVVLAGSNQKEFTLKPGGYVWEVKNSRGGRETRVTIVK